MTKLDHREPVPLERAQEARRIAEQLGIDGLRYRDYGDAARRRIFREAPMLKARHHLASRQQQLDAHALATMIRLEEQSLAETRLRHEHRAQLVRAGEGARLEAVRRLATLVGGFFAMIGKRIVASADSSSVARSILTDVGTGIPHRAASSSVIALSSTRCTIAGGGHPTVQ